MEKALPVIPAKRYFTIGEVSELCGVKPYVLRYWEQEFTQLKPMKRRGNRRYYQHHEVLLIRRIRELLYDHGFTISGARNRLTDSALAGRSALGGLGPAGPRDAELDKSTLEAGLEARSPDLQDAQAVGRSSLPLIDSRTDSLTDRLIDSQGDPQEQAAQVVEPALSGLYTPHGASAPSLQRQERALLRAELLSIRELLTV
jgi:DNA-binding transcriptional MerR regulator